MSESPSCCSDSVSPELAAAFWMAPSQPAKSSRRSPWIYSVLGPGQSVTSGPTPGPPLPYLLDCHRLFRALQGGQGSPPSLHQHQHLVLTVPLDRCGGADGSEAQLYSWSPTCSLLRFSGHTLPCDTLPLPPGQHMRLLRCTPRAEKNMNEQAGYLQPSQGSVQTSREGMGDLGVEDRVPWRLGAQF